MKTRRGLAIFYLATLLLYAMAFGEHFVNAFLFPDILISPIMALGSFVAGSTFLGGGAVAFPAMTKILGADAHMAKNFSLAIQSVGMTSASIYIVTRIKNLSFDFMAWYLGSAALGILTSLALLQNVFTSNDLRIGFTLFIFCFLIIYLWTVRFQDGLPHSEIKIRHYDHALIFICGLVGGLVSGLLGSGADLFAFCLLTLYFRVDIKLATQMSVMIMAFISILGIGGQALLFDGIEADVWSLWYLAAPVVLFGAPLGAIFCRRIPSHHLVLFITGIVLLELLTSFWLVPIAPERIVYYLAVLFFSILFLFFLRLVTRPKVN